MGKKGKKGKKGKRKGTIKLTVLERMQVEDLKKKIGEEEEEQKRLLDKFKKIKNPPVGKVIPVGIIENKQLTDDEWRAVDEANQMMTIPEQIQNAKDLLVFNLKKKFKTAQKKKQAPQNIEYNDKKIEEILTIINAFENTEDIVDRLKKEENLHPELIEFIIDSNKKMKERVNFLLTKSLTNLFCLKCNKIRKAWYNPIIKEYRCAICNGIAVPPQEAARRMAEQSSNESDDELAALEKSGRQAVAAEARVHDIIQNRSRLSERDRKDWKLYDALEPTKPISPQKARLQQKLREKKSRENDPDVKYWIRKKNQKVLNWKRSQERIAAQEAQKLIEEEEKEKLQEQQEIATISAIKKQLQDPNTTGEKRKKLKKKLARYKKKEKKRALAHAKALAMEEAAKKDTEEAVKKDTQEAKKPIRQSISPPLKERAHSPLQEYMKKEIERAREKLKRRGPPPGVDKLQFGLAPPTYTNAVGTKLEEGDLLDVISQKNSPAIWLIDRVWQLMEQNIDDAFNKAWEELGNARKIFGDKELKNISKNEIQLVIFLLKNHSDKLYIYGGIPRDLLQGDIKTKDVDIGLKNDKGAAIMAAAGNMSNLNKLFLEAENLIEEYFKEQGFKLELKKSAGPAVRIMIFNCGEDCKVEIEITSPSFFQIKAKEHNAEGPDLDVNNLMLVMPNQGVGRGEGYMFSFVHPFGQNFKEIKRNIRNKRMQLMKPFTAFAPSQPILPRLKKYLQRGWSIKIHKDYVRFVPFKGRELVGQEGFAQLKRLLPNIKFEGEGDFYILNKKVRGGKRTRKRRRKKRRKTRRRKRHYRKRSRKRKKRRMLRKSKKN